MVLTQGEALALIRSRLRQAIRNSSSEIGTASAKENLSAATDSQAGQVSQPSAQPRCLHARRRRGAIFAVVQPELLELRPLRAEHFDDYPPRVDYALTTLGRDLLDPISALAAWAVRDQAKIERVRGTYDGESPT